MKYKEALGWLSVAGFVVLFVWGLVLIVRSENHRTAKNEAESKQWELEHEKTRQENEQYAKDREAELQCKPACFPERVEFVHEGQCYCSHGLICIFDDKGRRCKCPPEDQVFEQKEDPCNPKENPWP